MQHHVHCNSARKRKGRYSELIGAYPGPKSNGCTKDPGLAIASDSPLIDLIAAGRAGACSAPLIWLLVGEKGGE